MELVTPVTGNRSDPTASAEKRAASRERGELWVEVHDTECDRCERVFKTTHPDDLVCKTCQRKEGNRP